MAFKESTKPNKNINTKRQKVPDDEDIDINKIVQGNRPRGGIYTANITAKQQKDKEADEISTRKGQKNTRAKWLKEYRRKKTYDRKSPH